MSHVHSSLCCCHIIGLFKAQKWLLQLCGFFNIQYNETTGRFAFGQQLVTYMVIYIFNTVACFFWIGENEEWIIDRFLSIPYALGCIHYRSQSHKILRTLNEMVRVHGQLRKALGELFCTSVRRAYGCAYLISLELCLLSYWQLCNYEATQTTTMIVIVLVFYLQLLLHANSFIWLSCMYVAMNRVFSTPLSSRRRLKMLSRMLREQPALRNIQLQLAQYFALYLAILVGILLQKLFGPIIAQNGFDMERWYVVYFRVLLIELRYAIYLLLLIATLLLVVWEFNRQRRRFERHLWLVQRPQQYQPFLKRAQQRLDVIDLMLCNRNRPDQLRNSSCLLSHVPFALVVYAQSLLLMLGRLLWSICMALLAALANGLQLSLDMEPAANCSSWSLALTAPRPSL